MTEQDGTYRPMRRAADQPTSYQPPAYQPTGEPAPGWGASRAVGQPARPAPPVGPAAITESAPIATPTPITEPTPPAIPAPITGAIAPAGPAPIAEPAPPAGPAPIAGLATPAPIATPAASAAATPPVTPAPIEGLGDAPETPIVSLPPLAAEVAGYPLSKRTGEPQHPGVVTAAMAAFAAAGLVAAASYWWYWWVAINIENFATSSKLIELFDPRPGSGTSVVLVCVMTLIGVIMTAAPAVAGYNAWHGASWSRVAGIVSCVTGLLAFFVIPWSWLALAFAAIGTGLLWTGQAKRYFEAFEQFANPPRPAIVPKAKVAYGPAPRYR